MGSLEDIKKKHEKAAALKAIGRQSAPGGKALPKERQALNRAVTDVSGFGQALTGMTRAAAQRASRAKSEIMPLEEYIPAQ